MKFYEMWSWLAAGSATASLGVWKQSSAELPPRATWGAFSMSLPDTRIVRLVHPLDDRFNVCAAAIVLKPWFAAWRCQHRGVQCLSYEWMRLLGLVSSFFRICGRVRSRGVRTRARVPEIAPLEGNGITGKWLHAGCVLGHGPPVSLGGMLQK